MNERIIDAIGGAFWDHLHELAGRCGHCGKIRCSGKKERSELPQLIELDDVDEAWQSAVSELKCQFFEANREKKETQ